eukprot:GHVR01029724.1.p1 GENE.GHVR01029724.1~~GHVR01029724.1.p1  ORF type:complete len:419 (-),score=89.74 GHVR01029724.1:49-1305(-)
MVEEDSLKKASEADSKARHNLDVLSARRKELQRQKEREIENKKEQERAIEMERERVRVEKEREKEREREKELQRQHDIIKENLTIQRQKEDKEKLEKDKIIKEKEEKLKNQIKRRDRHNEKYLHDARAICDCVAQFESNVENYLLTNTQLKFQVKRSIVLPYNQISATLDSVRMSISKLKEGFATISRSGDDASKYALVQLARNIEDSAHTNVSKQPSIAWAIAIVIANVVDGTAFQFLMGKLWSLSPYLIPDLCFPREGETDDQWNIRRRFNRVGDTGVSSEEKFFVRHASIARVVMACYIQKNCYDYVWSWLSRLLNQTRVSRIAPSLLFHVLHSCGALLHQKYHHSFTALIRVVVEVFLPTCLNIFPQSHQGNTHVNASVQQLRVLLQNFLNEGKFKQPEGFSLVEKASDIRRDV